MPAAAAKRTAASPLKPALKRQATDGDAGPHRMDTPPSGTGPITPPEKVEPPGEDCDIKELRNYVVTQIELLHKMAKMTQDHEAVALEKFNSIDEHMNLFSERVELVEPLIPHAHDLTMFSTVKNMVSHFEVEKTLGEKMVAVDKQFQDMK